MTSQSHTQTISTFPAFENVYSGMLPYDIEQIKRARHIRAYKNYFIDMFSTREAYLHLWGY
ncbi:MAG: hypothetical protein ACLVKR_01470 [Lachnospiraceae bacterium]